MGDNVFINDRAAVHSGSMGQSIAFPDVCLCPPTPPTGPIPTPLPNTVVAQDLTAGAVTVLIEGNPAGTSQSFFMKSTGNEVSRPTGGGVMTMAVQGSAHWGTFAMNVFFEGQPAVRHMDLLTHNHLVQPGNTPPSPWMSAMGPPSVPPSECRRGCAIPGRVNPARTALPRPLLCTVRLAPPVPALRRRPGSIAQRRWRSGGGEPGRYMRARKSLTREVEALQTFHGENRALTPIFLLRGPTPVNH